MSHRSHPLLAALGLAVATLAAAPAAAQNCVLEYQRADNMVVSTPNMAMEAIALGAGRWKEFITDWAYQGKLNDGTTYYGSHLRLARNVGPRGLKVYLKPGPFTSGYWRMVAPGESFVVAADLKQVLCPA